MPKRLDTRLRELEKRQEEKEIENRKRKLLIALIRHDRLIHHMEDAGVSFTDEMNHLHGEIMDFLSDGQIYLRPLDSEWNEYDYIYDESLSAGDVADKIMNTLKKGDYE